MGAENLSGRVCNEYKSAAFMCTLTNPLSKLQAIFTEFAKTAGNVSFWTVSSRRVASRRVVTFSYFRSGRDVNLIVTCV